MNGKHPPMQEERIRRFQEVAAHRQSNITIILENVRDPHNIGAVMRSCDSIGIEEVYILYTENDPNIVRQYIGNNSASGAKKWIKTHFFTDVKQCFNTVKAKYNRVYGTKLDQDSVSLYSLDLVDDIALVFGNEQKGISLEAAQYLDGNFIIPQYGMTQSLNISVACAVSLFEALRQRTLAGNYNQSFDSEDRRHQALFDYYRDQHYHYIPDKSI
jgi:tRNA (guanosine-2'-O-)-methyltransferase